MTDKRVALFLGGLALGGLFLWLALRDVDLADVAATLRAIDPLWVPAFLILLAVYYWLKLLRWHSLLGGRAAFSRTLLIEPMMIGFAANNLLPLRAGEFVRAWIAGNRLKRSRSEVLASVVIERLLDFLAIALVVMSGLVASSLDATLQSAPWALLAVFASVTVASVAALYLLPLVSSTLLPVLIKRLPQMLSEGLSKRLIAIATRFVDGLATLSDSDQRLSILVYSLLQWAILALCILLALFALGLPTPAYPMATTVLGLMVLGVSLPGSPGFIGTIEYAFVLGLALFGIDKADALASGIFYHVLSFSFVVISGGVCVLSLWLQRKSGSSGS